MQTKVKVLDNSLKECQQTHAVPKSMEKQKFINIQEEL
jgi:hypothetical protein